MPEHLADVWAAFWFLSTERQLGFGAVGPVPYCAILTYLDENNVYDKDNRDEMIYLINEMDAEYLRQVNSREAGNDG